MRIRTIDITNYFSLPEGSHFRFVGERSVYTKLNDELYAYRNAAYAIISMYRVVVWEESSDN